MLPPKKESKFKIPKSETEVKDEFSESLPKIIENKANSYILMQVKISIENNIRNVRLFLYGYIKVRIN